VTKEAINPDEPKDRQLIVDLLVHSADLSNPVLPDFPVVAKWARLVCREFTDQVRGDETIREREWKRGRKRREEDREHWGGGGGGRGVESWG
jgi:hypothetical protein